MFLEHSTEQGSSFEDGASGSFQPQCEVPLDHQEIVIDYLRNSPSFCIQKATTLMENLGPLLIPTASKTSGLLVRGCYGGIYKNI